MAKQEYKTDHEELSRQHKENCQKGERSITEEHNAVFKGEQ